MISSGIFFLTIVIYYWIWKCQHVLQYVFFFFALIQNQNTFIQIKNFSHPIECIKKCWSHNLKHSDKKNTFAKESQIKYKMSVLWMVKTKERQEDMKHTFKSFLILVFSVVFLHQKGAWNYQNHNNNNNKLFANKIPFIVKVTTFTTKLNLIARTPRNSAARFQAPLILLWQQIF